MFVSFLKYLGGTALAFSCIFAAVFIGEALLYPYSLGVKVLTLLVTVGLIYYCGRFFTSPLIGLLLLIASDWLIP